MAELCPLDEYQRACSRRLRAQIAFSLSRGSDALPLLLDAAKGVAAFNTALSRDIYLEAFADYVRSEGA